MMNRMETFSLSNTMRAARPRVPFKIIKEKILGKKYSLSVSLVGAATMKKMNRTFRKKNASTDILAFPLSEASGEILLHLPSVKKKAPQFGLTEREYLTYVFIHGCLHLKGMNHGRTMERVEDRWCRRFVIKAPMR